MATSSFRSSSQAPAASMRSWSFPCSSRRAFISSSVEISPNFRFTSSKRFRRSRVSFTPSSTFPRTSRVGSSSGSCER